MVLSLQSRLFLARNILEDRGRVMLEGGDSSTASLREYRNGIPTEQTFIRGANAQGKPCQRLVDIATPVNGA